MQCHKKTSYAGAAVRLAAYIVDQLIITMVIGVLAIFFFIASKCGLEEILHKNILFNYSIIAITYYIVKKLYFIVFTCSTGQTLGKKIFRIKVVSETISKPTVWSIIYREVIGRFLSELAILCYVGYLIIIPDEEKRGLHDRLGDTRVIYEESINLVYVDEESIVHDELKTNNIVPIQKRLSDEEVLEETEEESAEVEELVEAEEESVEEEELVESEEESAEAVESVEIEELIESEDKEEI